MYYQVIEKRKTGIIYTGMMSEQKEGLLEQARKAFPQYDNLQLKEYEGNMPRREYNELIF